MRGNFGQAIGTFLEFVGVGLLTGVAWKAECDRHKTAMKLIDTEFKLACTEIDQVFLKAENEYLKKQLMKYEPEEKEEA